MFIEFSRAANVGKRPLESSSHLAAENWQSDAVLTQDEEQLGTYF